jgi:hypothetical protein
VRAAEPATTDQQDVNAIGFFFYLPGTDPTSSATTGITRHSEQIAWYPEGSASGDRSDKELGKTQLVTPSFPIVAGVALCVGVRVRDAGYAVVPVVSTICERFPTALTVRAYDDIVAPSHLGADCATEGTEGERVRASRSAKHGHPFWTVKRAARA